VKRLPLPARLAAALLAFGTFLTLASDSARADAVDQKILEETPKVLQALKEKNYEAVGLLRFPLFPRG
jgi:hypothetical protein